MAKSMTSASLNQVNRKFLFLALILAGLSAVLIYAAISRSSGPSGGGSAAANVPVVVAKAAIPSGTTITAQMLDVRLVSQNAVAAGAFTTVESLVGEKVHFPIAANEQVLLSKIISVPAIGEAPVSYVVEEGHRALAIRTEPVISAGGLVVEGDYVDVYWVPENSLDDVEGAVLIGEDIEVLAVDQTIIQIPPIAPGLQAEGEEGAATAGEGNRIQGLDGVPIPTAITVTLMVTPEEVERIFCGEQSGVLRLAVRAFGDHTPSGSELSTCIILGTDR